MVDPFHKCEPRKPENKFIFLLMTCASVRPYDNALVDILCLVLGCLMAHGVASSPMSQPLQYPSSTP